ncbi:Histidine triad nucleotide-binding protein 2, mitochondrial, partial [Fragariocoptes setiger]
MAAEGETDTIFHKIMRKEIPATFVYEDDKCIAIKDIAPVAPIHYLIIPRKTIPKLSKIEEEDEPLLGHLLYVAKKIARDEKLDNGFRIAINDSHHACQTVFQLHLHLIGGRQLSASMG